MKKTGLMIVIIGLFAGAFIFLYGMSKKNMNTSYQGAVYAQSNGKSDSNDARGSQIYQQKCVSCHQVNGLGISGVFPPLKGSDFLKNEPKKRLIEQVMNGSDKGLVVNGVKYASPMPPQVSNTSDAVAVVNYILNSWGNNYGTATQKDADGIKKSTKNRKHMMMGGGMMRGGSMMH